MRAPGGAAGDPQVAAGFGRRGEGNRVGISRATWASRLLAVFSGLAVSLLLAESALRIAGVGRPVFHRPDRTYGQVLIPDAAGRWVNEGDAYVTINHDGFRDVAHTREKPADTMRIAVLGDSFAEALQVPIDQTFWVVLGRELAGCSALTGKKVEVLNFGVSGYSTAQEYMLLRQRVWAYSPDIVLLAFVTGNDVAENHPALGPGRAPFYRFEGDRLVLDSSQTTSLGAGGRAALWLVRHSRTLQLFNQIRLNLKGCGALRGCGEDRDIAQGEAGLRNQVYLEPTSDDWREAWRVTEELLRRVRDEVAAHHGRFFLVTLSNGIQVHPNAEVRERFRRQIGSTDLIYPDQRVVRFARRERITALTLAPELLRYAEEHRAYVHGFPGPGLGKGHWNREGHQVAGEIIASGMCRHLVEAAAVSGR
jgi:hypothetical protein